MHIYLFIYIPTSISSPQFLLLPLPPPFIMPYPLCSVYRKGQASCGYQQSMANQVVVKTKIFFIVFCCFFIICLFVSSICFVVLRGTQVSQASLNFLGSHSRTELPVFSPSLPTLPIMSSLAEVCIEVSIPQRSQAFNKFSCFISFKFSSLSITFIMFQYD